MLGIPSLHVLKLLKEIDLIYRVFASLLQPIDKYALPFKAAFAFPDVSTGLR
jgi:hypothetical protein